MGSAYMVPFTAYMVPFRAKQEPSIMKNSQLLLPFGFSVTEKLVHTSSLILYFQVLPRLLKAL